MSVIAFVPKMLPKYYISESELGGPSVLPLHSNLSVQGWAMLHAHTHLLACKDGGRKISEPLSEYEKVVYCFDNPIKSVLCMPFMGSFLQPDDVRIFFLNLDISNTVQVMCEVVKYKSLILE